jgi:hypothetical protein
MTVLGFGVDPLAGSLVAPEDPITGAPDYLRAFSFDVLESARGERRAIVARHRREADGAEVTDARIRQPAGGRFSGVVADKSDGYEPDLPDRAEALLGDLLELEESGAPVTVVAPGIRPLRSMAIEALDWEADPELHQIRIEIAFKPICLARLAVRAAVLDADLRALAAGGRVDVGAW